MAAVKVGSAKGFWNILKSVSVSEIGKEANRPLTVAIVGAEEGRADTIQMLFANDAAGLPALPQKTRSLPEPPFVQGFDNMSEEVSFPRGANVFDIVIDIGGGREGAPEGAPVYAIRELGGWEGTLDRILEDRPDLSLALARNFPVFRRRVGQRIIAQTAAANAQFALITGVAEAFPPTAILLPVNALSDIVILTKNQTMMTLRLAAAYGLPVDYKSRMKEVAPILANAFGWRAIARELVGAIPAVGFLARAMIAYAGTATVGKAAQVYYETGETVTASQAKRLYHEAYETSREKVRAIADSLRHGRGGGGGGRKRIPSANGASAELPAIDTDLPVPAEEEKLLPADHPDGTLEP